MRIKGLCLGQEEYNLVAHSKARTPEQEVQYALKTLETRGFHVHIREKYLVEDNTRQGERSSSSSSSAIGLRCYLQEGLCRNSS